MKCNLSNIAGRATDAAPNALRMLLVVMVLMPMFVGSAAAATDISNVQAQADGDTDFLCDDSDSQFVTTMRSLLTVLIVAGPVIGTAMAAFAQVAASGSKDKADKWMETRKKALISGWSVPIIVYMMDILATSVIGINISCIIP